MPPVTRVNRDGGRRSNLAPLRSAATFRAVALEFQFAALILRLGQFAAHHGQIELPISRAIASMQRSLCARPKKGTVELCPSSLIE